MAGRAKGLTEEQVRQIAAELEGGGKPPKVVLRESSSGLAAGTVGTVVRLNDPAESEEFVVVRIRNDELPFTPAELEPAPPRGRRGGTDGGQEAGQPRTASVAATTPAASASVHVTAGAGPDQATDRRPPVQPAAPSPAPARPAAAAPETRPASRADGGRRGAAGKRQAPRLTVQLQYDERGWTVEAARGARTVLKATPVRPTAALQVAQLLDNEQVGQAIAEIVQAEREEAERKAAELRAQLAEVEAVLAGYDEV